METQAEVASDPYSVLCVLLLLLSEQVLSDGQVKPRQLSLIFSIV